MEAGEGLAAAKLYYVYPILLLGEERRLLSRRAWFGALPLKRVAGHAADAGVGVVAAKRSRHTKIST